MKLENLLHRFKWENYATLTSSDTDLKSFMNGESIMYDGFTESLATLDPSVFQRSVLGRLLASQKGPIEFAPIMEGNYIVRADREHLGNLMFGDEDMSVEYDGFFGPDTQSSESFSKTHFLSTDPIVPMTDIHSMAVLHYYLQKMGEVASPDAVNKIYEIFGSNQNMHTAYASTLIDLSDLLSSIGQDHFDIVVNNLGPLMTSSWAPGNLRRLTDRMDSWQPSDPSTYNWNLLSKSAVVAFSNTKRPTVMTQPPPQPIMEKDNIGLPIFSPTNLDYAINKLDGLPEEVKDKALSAMEHFLDQSHNDDLYYGQFTNFVKELWGLNKNPQEALAGIDLVFEASHYPGSRAASALTSFYRSPDAVRILQPLRTHLASEVSDVADGVGRLLSILVDFDRTQDLGFLARKSSFDFDSVQDRLDYLITVSEMINQGANVMRDPAIADPQYLLDFLKKIDGYAEPVKRAIKGSLYSNSRTIDLVNLMDDQTLNGGRKKSRAVARVFDILKETSEHANSKWHFAYRKVCGWETTPTIDQLEYLAVTCELIDQGSNLFQFDTAPNLDSIQQVLWANIGNSYGSGDPVELPHYNLSGVTLSTDKVLGEVDPNINFLMRKAVSYGSISAYLRATEEPQMVMDMMRDHGYDTSFFVDSGQTVNSAKQAGGVSRTWQETLSDLVFWVTGDQGSNPQISIPKFSPKTAYRIVAPLYAKASRGDKVAAKELVEYISQEVNKRIEKFGRLPVLEEVTDRFDGFLGQLYGRNFQVSDHIEARMWERNVPEAFYDNKRLSCCVFFPTGAEKYSIPLMTMDPQTSMLEFWVDAMDETTGISTLFAGKNRTMLMDSWEVNEMVYSVLPSQKTKRFALNSIIIAADNSMVGPSDEKTVIIENTKYGRPLELVNYVKARSVGSESIRFEENVPFELVDPHGIAFRKAPGSRENHGSGSFHGGQMKGSVTGYVINVGKYLQEFGVNPLSRAA